MHADEFPMNIWQYEILNRTKLCHEHFYFRRFSTNEHH